MGSTSLILTVLVTSEKAILLKRKTIKSNTSRSSTASSAVEKYIKFVLVLTTIFGPAGISIPLICLLVSFNCTFPFFFNSYMFLHFLFLRFVCDLCLKMKGQKRKENRYTAKRMLKIVHKALLANLVHRWQY